jgi:hypothetical protein
MALIVVGGHSRDVGKTSVVAGLIAAMPEREWLAVKITQFGHGICSESVEPCDCSLQEEHIWSLDWEAERHSGSDTARFLAAGASRALWVRTLQGRLAEAMPALREAIEGARDVIIESNSVMRFLRPDLYLSVLDPETADFKESSREMLDRADALLIHTHPAAVRWERVSLKPVAGRPMFGISRDEYVPAALVEWVKGRLAARAPV